MSVVGILGVNVNLREGRQHRGTVEGPREGGAEEALKGRGKAAQRFR